MYKTIGLSLFLVVVLVSAGWSARSIVAQGDQALYALGGSITMSINDLYKFGDIPAGECPDFASNTHAANQKSLIARSDLERRHMPTLSRKLRDCYGLPS